jgi:hypothetical protein
MVRIMLREYMWFSHRVKNLILCRFDPRKMQDVTVLRKPYQP